LRSIAQKSRAQYKRQIMKHPMSHGVAWNTMENIFPLVFLHNSLWCWGDTPRHVSHREHLLALAISFETAKSQPQLLPIADNLYGGVIVTA